MKYPIKINKYDLVAASARGAGHNIEVHNILPWDVLATHEFPPTSCYAFGIKLFRLAIEHRATAGRRDHFSQLH